MDNQNQTTNKQEQLKNLENIQMMYTSMKIAFENAVQEKNAQIKAVGQEIERLRSEVEKENTSEKSKN